MMSREGAVCAFLDRMQQVDLHGFLLTLDGQTVAEGYWPGFAPDRAHRMFSVSKSVTSLAIGLLRDDGKLALDDRIADYFADWLPPQASPLLTAMTIEQLLRMATCYDRAMYDRKRDACWAKAFFTGTPTHAPGTLFHYDTSASQALCALVERLTGKPILDFVRQRLFEPLGMTGEMRWLGDPSGASQGGSGLCMTLRDMSTLANFCMSDGKGLLSADYLRAATSKQTDTHERAAREERHGYGYQFWRTRDGFSMYGMGGQMAICVPQKRLCLCTTGDTQLEPEGVQPIYDAFFDCLYDVDGLESSPQDAARLAQRLSSLARAPLPSVADAKREVRVRLQPSKSGIRELCITPDALCYTTFTGAHTLRYQPGSWLFDAYPGLDEPCMTSAGWITPDRFELRCDLIGYEPGGIGVTVSLSDSRATVLARRTSEVPIEEFGGLAWGYVERTVAPEGGDYATLQAAIDDVPTDNREPVIIRVKAGTYREKVILNKDHVTLIGEAGARLVWGDHALQLLPDGTTKNTFLTATLLVTGHDVSLEDLTVENDAGDGREVGQAVALYAAGDRFACRRCTLLAHQDTLYCGPTLWKTARWSLPYIVPQGVENVADRPHVDARQYYVDCDITGDVDFIFGPYRCWFERCTLRCNARGGFYTAANTPQGQPFGFVFNRCTLTGECETGACYLGRPWREYAATAFLACDMDECVSPQGFCDWESPFRPVTDRLCEYASTGAGAQGKRHAAMGQLDDEQVKRYTVQAVLGGADGWQPDKA